MADRKIFLTGTRADFGKLKSLMLAVDRSDRFECEIFVTGMHMLDLYGRTVDEIFICGFQNIHTFVNTRGGEPMEVVLSNTIAGLSKFVSGSPPDLIVVHGDRCETLAGAITGSLRNIRVAHIEGGELSGTVDELIRHAVSKMSHLHFVANAEAGSRLRQLGELPESIFVIGSPDVDIMVSGNLPTLEQAKKRYGIAFERYAVLLFHPVVTEIEDIPHQVGQLVNAVLSSGLNYVVIYPNNDRGSEHILQEYRRFADDARFRVFPSVRFEHFVTLLRNARFIVGNSSAGIREAPYFGLPTVNIGTRQLNRYNHSSIIHTGYDQHDIERGIAAARAMGQGAPIAPFGDGQSLDRFMSVLSDEVTWRIKPQKQFNEIRLPSA